jgi:predicted SAM-dependent methyltransferase
LEAGEIYAVILKIGGGMNLFPRIIRSFLKGAFKIFGYNIRVDISSISANGGIAECGSELNLNIAAGNYVISGFKSLDIYTPHYYKSKELFLASRIEYNLRSDQIPFGNNSVDNIYISHAIEHVETEAVLKFFYEAFRVLKVGGVLRVACPDAKFLYEVSEFQNGYWAWRKNALLNRDVYEMTDQESCEQFDYFIREVATPRMRFYKNRVEGIEMHPAKLLGSRYMEVVGNINSRLKFRPEYPGDHINSWDFDSVKCIGEKVGFKRVINSKYRASVSARMQGADFDKTFPQMSLYVDLVK